MLKRHLISTSKVNPNFIGSWMMPRLQLCDQIVTYFDANISKQVSGVTRLGVVNRNVKDRTDICVMPRDFKDDSSSIFYKYFEILSECLSDYGRQWPFLKGNLKSLDTRSFNIGKYNEGQHFSRIHAERSFASMEREFAFMTYLSDDFEGGSTYFSHYDLDIVPIKGLTLIWPAMWTHAHKGNVITKGSKYILTGWLNLVPPSDLVNDI